MNLLPRGDLHGAEIYYKMQRGMKNQWDLPEREINLKGNQGILHKWVKSVTQSFHPMKKLQRNKFENIQLSRNISPY